MIMNAVLAVALGLTPVNPTFHSQTIQASEYQGLIGPYSQSTDSRGTAHLKGIDRRTGRPFDIEVAANGHVEGFVGETFVTFDFARAA
jgi:hypothetical protein